MWKGIILYSILLKTSFWISKYKLYFTPKPSEGLSPWIPLSFTFNYSSHLELPTVIHSNTSERHCWVKALVTPPELRGVLMHQKLNQFCWLFVPRWRLRTAVNHNTCLLFTFAQSNSRFNYSSWFSRQTNFVDDSLFAPRQRQSTRRRPIQSLALLKNLSLSEILWGSPIFSDFVECCSQNLAENKTHRTERVITMKNEPLNAINSESIKKQQHRQWKRKT